MKILSLKTEALLSGLQTQNYDFLERGYKDFDKISVIYGDRRPK
jgi:hypothetical protein